MDLLHEEYESDGDLVLFRCTACGYTTMSLGFLHSHVEEHWPIIRRFTHLLPFVDTGAEKWMKHTEVLRVDDTTEIELGEVEGL